MFVSILLPYIKIEFLLFFRCVCELVIPEEGDEERMSY
jgi:hypothetical protein